MHKGPDNHPESPRLTHILLQQLLNASGADKVRTPDLHRAEATLSETSALIEAPGYADHQCVHLLFRCHQVLQMLS